MSSTVKPGPLVLTRQQCLHLLDGLTKLRRWVKNDLLIADDLGICFNWTGACTDAVSGLPYVVVSHLAASWKHSTHPGDTQCCVPVPEDTKLGVWEGRNLVLRLDLITHLRKRLHDLKRRAKD